MYFGVGLERKHEALPAAGLGKSPERRMDWGPGAEMEEEGERKRVVSGE